MDHEHLNCFSCELTELYDHANVVYGFQVLKKFGDVVWHVNWSVTGNILVVSVLWRRQGEVCIFLNDVLLIEAIFWVDFLVMHALLLLHCHFCQFCPM